MMSDPLLAGLSFLIAAVCGFMIWRGLKTGRPPGQRGLKGTGLEDSKTLLKIQVVLLGILLLAAVFAGFTFLDLT